MTQQDSDHQPDPPVEPIAKRLGKGFAVDLVFGIVLVVASSLVGNFSIGFLIAIGTIIAAYLAWRFFSHRDSADSPKE